MVLQTSFSVTSTSPGPLSQADVPNRGEPEMEYEVETGTWGGPVPASVTTPLSVHTFRRVTTTEKPTSTTAAADSGHRGGFSNGRIRPDSLVASLGMTAAIIGPVAGFLLLVVLGLGYYTMRLHQVSN